ncbi:MULTISPECIES: hypothetical protein [Bacillus cereus group]|uniref:hypothetical protein n=1 Tax=Bacillus cereus group TaxID=86661 RepID=UPI00397DA909
MEKLEKDNVVIAPRDEDEKQHLLNQGFTPVKESPKPPVKEKSPAKTPQKPKTSRKTPQKKSQTPKDEK